MQSGIGLTATLTDTNHTTNTASCNSLDVKSSGCDRELQKRLLAVDDIEDDFDQMFRCGITRECCTPTPPRRSTTTIIKLGRVDPTVHDDVNSWGGEASGGWSSLKLKKPVEEAKFGTKSGSASDARAEQARWEHYHYRNGKPRDIAFVFKHHEDIGKYIEQYRQEYTLANIKESINGFTDFHEIGLPLTNGGDLTIPPIAPQLQNCTRTQCDCLSRSGHKHSDSYVSRSPRAQSEPNIRQGGMRNNRSAPGNITMLGHKLEPPWTSYNGPKVLCCFDSGAILDSSFYEERRKLICSLIDRKVKFPLLVTAETSDGKCGQKCDVVTMAGRIMKPNPANGYSIDTENKLVFIF